MNIILSILITIGMSLFAFTTFILAENKEEIWNDILDRIGRNDSDY